LNGTDFTATVYFGRTFIFYLDSACFIAMMHPLNLIFPGIQLLFYLFSAAFQQGQIPSTGYRYVVSQSYFTVRMRK